TSPNAPSNHRPAGRPTTVGPTTPRPSAARRGYGWKWRNPEGTGQADVFLRDNPLCVVCEAEGRLTQATTVDHIVPHKGDMGLFWSQSNWRPLCKPCHDRATARYDGGLGRAIVPKPTC